MGEHEFNDLFLDFKEQYELTNPPPTMKSIRSLGWEFYLALIWAIFAVLMVASQTASEFYHAKIMSGMNERVAFIASLMVLGAVEGGLVIGAAIKASTARRYSKRLINLAISIILICGLVVEVDLDFHCRKANHIT